MTSNEELTAKDWYWRGAKILDNSDKEIACYGEAIQLDPRFYRAFNLRGSAHLNRGETDAALSDFREMIRLKPTYTEGYVMLGYTGYRLQRWHEALTAFEQCLALPQRGENRDWVQERVEEIKGKLK